VYEYREQVCVEARAQVDDVGMHGGGQSFHVRAAAPGWCEEVLYRWFEVIEGDFYYLRAGVGFYVHEAVHGIPQRAEDLVFILLGEYWGEAVRDFLRVSCWENLVICHRHHVLKDPVQEVQCSQASSPSVFCLRRDGRQLSCLCAGRTPIS